MRKTRTQWIERRDELVVKYCLQTITPAELYKLDVLNRVLMRGWDADLPRLDWENKQRYRKAMATIHAHRLAYAKIARDLKPTMSWEDAYREVKQSSRISERFEDHLCTPPSCKKDTK